MPERQPYQLFNTEVELLSPVTPGATVNVRSSCADITFVNLHPTATAYINGYPLPPPPAGSVPGTPGGSVVFGANRYEFNKANYNVLAPVPAADANNRMSLGVYVFRKHYTKVVDEQPQT